MDLVLFDLGGTIYDDSTYTRALLRAETPTGGGWMRHTSGSRASGATLKFLLSAKQDATAAKRFQAKAAK